MALGDRNPIRCIRCDEDGRSTVYFNLTVASADVDIAESTKDVSICDDYICKVCIHQVLSYLLQTDAQQCRTSMHKLHRVSFIGGL